MSAPRTPISPEQSDAADPQASATETAKLKWDLPQCCQECKHLMKNIPALCQVGLNILYAAPVKLTCIDVNASLVVFGGFLAEGKIFGSLSAPQKRPGVIFVYNRELNKASKIEAPDHVTCLKLFSSEYVFIGVGTDNGTVAAYRLPSSLPGKSRKLVRVLSIAHKSSITALEWSSDASCLFSGDSAGFINASHFEFDRGNCKSGCLASEETAVVQLSSLDITLGASTLEKAVLIDLPSRVTTKIGSAPRKKLGNFGISLFATMIEPAATSESLPVENFAVSGERNSYGNFEASSTPDAAADAPSPGDNVSSSPFVLYTGRPGFRLWKANSRGTVIETLLFKDLLSSVPLIDASPSSRRETSSENTEHIARLNSMSGVSELILATGEGVLLMFSQESLFVLDVQCNRILCHYRFPLIILSMAVVKSHNEVFVLCDQNRLFRIQPHSADYHEVSTPLKKPQLLSHLYDFDDQSSIASDVSTNVPSLHVDTLSVSSGYSDDNRNAFSPTSDVASKRSAVIDSNTPNNSSSAVVIPKGSKSGSVSGDESFSSVQEFDGNLWFSPDRSVSQNVDLNVIPLKPKKLNVLRGQKYGHNRPRSRTRPTETLPEQGAIAANDDHPNKDASVMQNFLDAPMQSRDFLETFLDSFLQTASTVAPAPLPVPVVEHQMLKASNSSDESRTRELDAQERKLSTDAVSSLNNDIHSTKLPVENDEKKEAPILSAPGLIESASPESALTSPECTKETSAAIVHIPFFVPNDEIDSKASVANLLGGPDGSRALNNPVVSGVKSSDASVCNGSIGHVDENHYSTCESSTTDGFLKQRQPTQSLNVPFFSADRKISDDGFPQQDVDENGAYYEPRRQVSEFVDSASLLRQRDIWTTSKLSENPTSIACCEGYVCYVDRNQTLRFGVTDGIQVDWSISPDIKADAIFVSETGNLVWRLLHNVAYALVKPSRRKPSGQKWTEALRDVQRVALSTSSAWVLKLNGAVCVQAHLSSSRPCFKTEAVACSHSVVQLACSEEAVWALTDKGSLIMRVGLSKANPVGDDWIELYPEIESRFTSIHLYNGYCWAVDLDCGLWFTSGISFRYPIGSNGGRWWRVMTPHLLALIESKKQSSKSTGLPCFVVGSESGLWFAIGSELYFTRSSLTGHRWSRPIPKFLAIVDRFTSVVASCFYDQNTDFLWLMRNNGEIIAYQEQRETLHSLPPSTSRHQVFQRLGCTICVSAAPGYVWTLDSAGKIFIRSGVDVVMNPTGDEWIELELGQLENTNTKLQYLSCSLISVWAIDSKGNIHVRPGCEIFATGGLAPVWVSLQDLQETTLKSSQCIFTQVCVSPDGLMVWALAKGGSVYCRVGVKDDLAFGTDWISVEGLSCRALAVGCDSVWVLTHSGFIYRRIGVSAQNLLGDYWKPIASEAVKAISATPHNKIWALHMSEGYLLKHDAKLFRNKTSDIHTSGSVHDEVSVDWELV